MQIKSVDNNVFVYGEQYLTKGDYRVEFKGSGTGLKARLVAKHNSSFVGGSEYHLWSEFTDASDTAFGTAALFAAGIATIIAKNLAQDGLVTNATTSALSLATLNSTYPNATTPIGYRVSCVAISGGGLVYTKTGAATWTSNSITAVS